MLFKLKLIVAFLFQYPFVSALSTAFLGSVFIATPLFLRIARCFFSTSVREYTPEHHQKKDNTPTMGGIVIGLLTCAMVWLSGYMSMHVLLLLLCYLLFACIGAYDDVCKIYAQEGISARSKFCAQVICASIVVGFWFFTFHPDTFCVIPFFNYYLFDWGYVFIPWAVFIIVACSNAVNITDGLDGLATVVVLPGLVVCSFLAFWIEQYDIAYCAVSLSVSLLSFLVFNWYPAQLFMGDVGSLPLGAVWAFITLMLRQELLWPFMGIVCVAEIVSVILQVVWFKTRGKRLFLMAPLHHHFELLEWHGTQITIFFGVISAISCLVVLCLYLCT